MKHWAALFAIAVGTTGCLGDSESANSVIPWSAQRPPEFKAPALAAPCRPSQLRVGHFSQGAGGSAVGGITFRVIRGPRCSLLGRPRVAFAGGTAATVPWQVHPMRSSLVENPDDRLPPEVLRSVG